jgi:4-amino-4-deoxy-L-arabinose transferase-like glycosyltransferase
MKFNLSENEKAPFKNVINIIKLRWVELLFAVLLFPLLILLAKTLPLNYDEAYNLQVPNNIVKYGKYDTTYGTRSFDGFSTITTGPTVLFPISVVYALFGIGVLRSRSITLLYFFCFVVLLFLFFRKKNNVITSIIVTLIILANPTIFSLGLTVLGEIPALFFILLGIMLWTPEKHNLISLLFFGLAAITKLYLLLFIVPLILKIIFEELGKLKHSIFNFERIIISINVFMVPTIIWEIIKFFLIGKNDYPNYLKEMSSFFLQNSFFSRKFNILQLLFNRLSVFSSSLFPKISIWITIILLVLMITSIMNKIIHQKLSSETTFLFVTSFVYMLWWIFISKEGWWRHVFPFAIVFTLLIANELINFLKKINMSKIKRYALNVFIMSIIIIFIYVPGFTSHYHNLRSTELNSQRIFAQKVQEYHSKGYQFGVMGWWQAPEISFLSGGIQFINIEHNYDLLEQSEYLVIYTKLHELLVPETAQLLLNYVGDPVFISPDNQYILYSPK